MNATVAAEAFICGKFLWAMLTGATARARLKSWPRV